MDWAPYERVGMAEDYRLRRGAVRRGEAAYRYDHHHPRPARFRSPNQRVAG